MSLKTEETKKAVLAQIDKEVHPDLYTTADKHLAEIIETGKMPKDLMQIDDVFIEFAYKKAYNLFRAGKYSEASPIFYFLFELNPIDNRFIFSYAACFHALKQYDLAAGNYMAAKALDTHNPIISFHLFDCHQQLHQSVLALGYIEDCIDLCGSEPKYSELKERAILERNGYMEKIKNNPNNS